MQPNYRYKIWNHHHRSKARHKLSISTFQHPFHVFRLIENGGKMVLAECYWQELTKPFDHTIRFPLDSRWNVFRSALTTLWNWLSCAPVSRPKSFGTSEAWNCWNLQKRLLIYTSLSAVFDQWIVCTRVEAPIVAWLSWVDRLAALAAFRKNVNREKSPNCFQRIVTSSPRADDRPITCDDVAGLDMLGTRMQLPRHIHGFLGTCSKFLVDGWKCWKDKNWLLMFTFGGRKFQDDNYFTQCLGNK